MNGPPAPLWHAYDQYRVARSGMASQRHDHVSRAKIHEAISRNFDWPPGNFFTRLLGWYFKQTALFKGQLNSKWIYEVGLLQGHRFSQNANQKSQGFLPYHTNKDCSTFFGVFLVSVGSLFGYDSCVWP